MQLRSRILGFWGLHSTGMTPEHMYIYVCVVCVCVPEIGLHLLVIASRYVRINGMCVSFTPWRLDTNKKWTTFTSVQLSIIKHQSCRLLSTHKAQSYRPDVVILNCENGSHIVT